MISDRALLSYILRPEAFGGIVFDPLDGTQLELDHEAYALAKRVLRGGGLYWDRGKRAFARQLKRELHWRRWRGLRELRPQPWQPAAPVPTLSAPTLVDFQITSRCDMGCPHCYASAVKSGTHVPWPELELVVRQAHDCGVCQIAIGGGEPLLHPDIIPLLRLCQQQGIVPNLTTGGMDLDDDNIAAMKRYCGAIGLSLEGVGSRYERWRHRPFADFIRSLHRLQEAGIRTVLQITLSASNLDQLDELADFCLDHQPLYGVIFLAYKNVGRGTRAAQGLGSLPSEQVSAALMRTFLRLRPHMRVGYDCCMTPGIAGVEAAQAVIDHSNLEGCSATRGSVGISTDLDVIPCTFTGGYRLGNLRDRHLREVWQGAQAEAFRRRIQHKRSSNPACAGCGKQANCLGGCPVMPLINCHRDHLGAGETVAVSSSADAC
ncbi:MAG: radical SAM protein [Planctomycetota bacterium]